MCGGHSLVTTHTENPTEPFETKTTEIIEVHPQIGTPEEFTTRRPWRKQPEAKCRQLLSVDESYENGRGEGR